MKTTELQITKKEYSFLQTLCLFRDYIQSGLIHIYKDGRKIWLIGELNAVAVLFFKMAGEIK
jgi:hypothetical protein